ncbi:kinase-like domain-containing protein [Corynascus novoguineensis]|uniref:non-specific serine/threonine protein kinase n=1 Tax=Corynascus novoguineensis TaxID=1126955 RepID=A0AAN7HNS3_9PEZI|nr:kinase-like domain-containing protein [Corynascus novoguineensis]
MLDASQYNVGIPAEDITQYCSGGYHPVHLHDHFKDGRYEILNKLGFGSFSTVWLAKDHVTQRHVSIKIVVANGSEPQNHEVEILRHVQANDLHSHPGRRSVTQLLDSFFHEGPNGRHLCVVLELLGPRLSWLAEKSQNYRLKADLARRVSARIVEALAYLHSCGVAHGDIHMGNILLRLPPWAGAESLSASASPQIGKVTKKDGSPLEKGVPEYLVEPLEMDFGSAFFASSPPKMIFTSLSLHPPESVFKRPLTQAVDIWNLGCTLYELAIGRTPFEAGFDNRELIPHKDLRRRLPETLQFTRKDLERLGKYLRKMLIVDPQQRATAAELASDTSWTLADETSERQ